MFIYMCLFMAEVIRRVRRLFVHEYNIILYNHACTMVLILIIFVHNFYTMSVLLTLLFPVLLLASKLGCHLVICQ